MNSLPSISVEAMREVDRLMVQDYHISLVQMMENAGRNLAHLARLRFMGGDPRGKRVIALCGLGGNGGGGLVAARRLHCWGATVSVSTTAPIERYKGVPARQIDILSRLNIPIDDSGKPRASGEADLVLDALIGYGLRGTPCGSTATLIDWANAQHSPVMSLDVPSGMNADSGMCPGAAIHAAATMTLAAPKNGLDLPTAKGFVGEYYLADIGVPFEILTSILPEHDLSSFFSLEDIIRLR